LTTPRTIWSACGIDAEIHRDLDGLVELRLGALLDHLHRLVERIELVAVDAFARLSCCAFLLAISAYSHHLDAHRTGGAFDHLHRRLDRLAVQVLHLLLGDLLDLRLA
jgi:hypothetical protein